MKLVPGQVHNVILTRSCKRFVVDIAIKDSVHGDTVYRKSVCI